MSYYSTQYCALYNTILNCAVLYYTVLQCDARLYVLFCLALIIRTCHDSVLSLSFGFSAAVYVSVCLEASHTVYSLAPFLPPDRPIVSHWCTVGEIHTRVRLFLIHREQADNWHVENGIHAVFPREEAVLSDKKKKKKIEVRAGLWRPKAVSYILIRLVLTVATS